MHRVMPLPVLEAVDCPQRLIPPTAALDAMLLAPVVSPTTRTTGQIPSPFAVHRDAVSRESFPPGPMRLYPSVGGILTSTSHVKCATLASHVRVPVVTFLEDLETSFTTGSVTPGGDDVSPYPNEGSPRHDGFCSDCMSFECHHQR